MAANALVIYLNDHLGGSRAGMQLVDNLVESTREPGARATLAAVRDEIAADREVLEEIINRLSGGASVVREIGGWLGEKATQLKLMMDDPAGGELRHFEALELLSLGIEGKSSLWRALSTVAASVPELQGVDFANLVRRAADQRARVENLRTNAARAALVGAKSEDLARKS
jgi:hypothetical protein